MCIKLYIAVLSTIIRSKLITGQKVKPTFTSSLICCTKAKPETLFDGKIGHTTTHRKEHCLRSTRENKPASNNVCLMVL